jgi:GxxExxY protein
MPAARYRGMETNQRDPETYTIIGAAMEVHRELGCGYLEPVYVEALEIELRIRRVPYRREVSLPISYKGQVLKKFYRVDFICYDDVLVELKALHALGPIEESQLINYLCAAKRARGLLLNFGTRSLQYKRRVWRYEQPVESSMARREDAGDQGAEEPAIERGGRSG